MNFSLDILNSNKDQLLCIVIFFAFWSTLSFLVHRFTFQHNQMSEEKKIQTRILIVPMIHGLSTTLIGFFLNPFSDFKYKISYFSEENLPEYNLYCFFSASYFIGDMFDGSKYGFLNKQLFIHHMASCSSLLFPLFSDYGAAISVVALTFGETTNFSLNLKTMLENMGMKDTMLYEVNKLTFYLAFIVIRVPVAFYYLVIPMVSAPNCPLIHKVTGSFLLLQSYVVSFEMMRVLKRKLWRKMNWSKDSEYKGTSWVQNFI